MPKFCNKCQKKFDNDVDFCPYCGKPVIEYVEWPKQKFCTKCGAQLDGDEDFCPQCGIAIHSVSHGKINSYVKLRLHKTSIGNTIMDKFFSFDGRLNRKGYVFRIWFFSVLISLAGRAVGYFDKINGWLICIVLITGLVGIVGTLSCVTRRLHDLNYSGWLQLFGLIPIVNIAFGVWLLFSSGTVGPNKYGEDPLGRVAQEVSLSSLHPSKKMCESNDASAKFLKSLSNDRK